MASRSVNAERVAELQSKIAERQSRIEGWQSQLRGGSKRAAKMIGIYSDEIAAWQAEVDKLTGKSPAV